MKGVVFWLHGHPQDDIKNKYKLNEFDNERIKQIVQEINNLENQVFEKKISYNFFEEKFIVIN